MQEYFLLRKQIQGRKPSRKALKKDAENTLRPQHLLFKCNFQRLLLPFTLVFILVEQKVLLCRIVRPYIFNGFVYLAFILYLL